MSVNGLVSMKVEGLSALESQLMELGALAAGKALAKAARTAFTPVLDRAKELVPVDTGLLRDSLRLTVKRPKSGPAVVVVGLKIAVGKGGGKSDLKKLAGNDRKDAWRKSAHWRWHFVEFGTRKMAAKPFLRPAFFANKDKMIETFKEELAHLIEQAWKRKAKAAGYRGRSAG